MSNQIMSSISLKIVTDTIKQYINGNLIPYLDKNDSIYKECVKKWVDIQQNIFKNILFFKSDQDFTQKFKQCLINQSKSQKRIIIIQHKLNNGIQKKLNNSIQQKLNNCIQQTLNNSIQQKLNNEIRQRRISLDQHEVKRQQLPTKQQRSSSFNDINIKQQLISQQKPSTSQRQILSFKSISDYHKNRKPTLTTIKETNSYPSQLDQFGSDQLGNRNSIKEIGSMRKIHNIQNKITKKSQELPEVARNQNQNESQIVMTNVNTNQSSSYIMEDDSKSKIKSYIMQPQYSSIQVSPSVANPSFSKFLLSFKKLSSVFDSNHSKLVRQEFTSKYINC